MKRRMFAVRVSLFAALWWVLTTGSPDAWIFGVPVVLSAAAVSLALAVPSSGRLSFSALAGFVPYFLWRSMVGSVDVAWRALHPRLPIAPVMEQYPLRLPRTGPSRIFFADILSLLPGTLSADLRDDSLVIHILSARPGDALADTRRLEAMVAAVFGVRLSPARTSRHDHD